MSLWYLHNTIKGLHPCFILVRHCKERLLLPSPQQYENIGFVVYLWFRAFLMGLLQCAAAVSDILLLRVSVLWLQSKHWAKNTALLGGKKRKISHRVGLCWVSFFFIFLPGSLNLETLQAYFCGVHANRFEWICFNDLLAHVHSFYWSWINKRKRVKPLLGINERD